MHLSEMDPKAAELAVRAMVAVAGADGDEDARERSLIEAAAGMLGVSGPLSPLAVDELAGAALEPADAERVVQAAILTALMDGVVEPAEVATVRALAEAADVAEPRVHNLAQLARGHTTLLWIDLARRSWAKDVFVNALREEGPAGVWKIVGPLLGGGADPEVSARYLALGELPEDTLGYAYFRFLTERELAFPGEPRSVAESGVWHDVAHVLGGYGTEPREEVQLVSFIAGFSRHDPFFWLFTITLQFHLAIGVSPYSEPAEGLVDPSAMLAAFERGAAMSVDLSAPEFDPWPLFERRLEDVRAELGVPPRV